MDRRIRTIKTYCCPAQADKERELDASPKQLISLSAGRHAKPDEYPPVAMA
jgi:hypothetical protein